MARMEKKLSTRDIAALSKPGRHSDGGGMYLAISPDGGSKSWVYLFRWGEKVREMGLGAWPTVSLTEARKLHDKWRQVLRNGENPIEVRKAIPKQIPTFGKCATDLITSKSSQWRSARHREQWNMLQEQAKALWPMSVDKINTTDVLRVLKPEWDTKRETTSRLRSRIELVLEAAAAHGWRTGPNPAAWGTSLRHILPARKRVEREHHAAMPYTDIPAFITHLHGLQNTTELASLLEFIILTAARTSEAREARWQEINLVDRVWTIPAHRMKSGREHRVPLCARALELIGDIPGNDNDFVFPGQVRRKSFSPGAVAQFLRGLGLQITVHGFRSAFRDYAGNETTSAREVAEAALAHAIGDQSERAYRRGDALDKRRKLMEEWARYIEPKGFKDNVVNLR